MQGYITYCFSDWLQETFANGIMLMKNGARTDTPVRHPLPDHWWLEKDFYVKPDPSFNSWTYSRCHKRLRILCNPGDILFFRTLWRSRSYFVGYFDISQKLGDPDDPILVADRKRSLFIPRFIVPSTPQLIRRLNSRATKRHEEKYHPNVFAMFLGRDFLALDSGRTEFLKDLLDREARQVHQRRMRD